MPTATAASNWPGAKECKENFQKNEKNLPFSPRPFRPRRKFLRITSPKDKSPSLLLALKLFPHFFPSSLARPAQ
jgi:hypothetical protein